MKRKMMLKIKVFLQIRSVTYALIDRRKDLRSRLETFTKLQTYEMLIPFFPLDQKLSPHSSDTSTAQNSPSPNNQSQDQNILLKAINLANNPDQNEDEFKVEGPPTHRDRNNQSLDTQSTSGISESEVSVVNYQPKPPPIPYDSDSDSDADGPILYRDDPAHIQEKKKLELRQMELDRQKNAQNQHAGQSSGFQTKSSKNSTKHSTNHHNHHNHHSKSSSSNKNESSRQTAENLQITGVGNQIIHSQGQDSDSDEEVDTSGWAKRLGNVMRNDTVSRGLDKQRQGDSGQGGSGDHRMPKDSHSNSQNHTKNISSSSLGQASAVANQQNHSHTNHIGQSPHTGVQYSSHIPAPEHGRMTVTPKLKRNPDASFRKPNPQDQNIKIHLAREESQRRKKEISSILIRRLSQRPSQNELTDKNIYKDRASAQSLADKKRDVKRELSRKLSIRPTLQDLIDKGVIFNEYVDIYDIENFDRKADKPWLRLTQYDKVSSKTQMVFGQ